MEGKKRFLTLKSVPLDASGEVSYTALNAVTSAVLTVKGKQLFQEQIIYVCIEYIMHVLIKRSLFVSPRTGNGLHSPLEGRVCT